MSDSQLTPRMGASDSTDYMNQGRLEASIRAHQEGVDRERREVRVAEAFRLLSLEEREALLGFDSEGNVADA